MTFTRIILLTAVLAITCPAANAGPSANRTKEGGGLLNSIFATSTATPDEHATTPSLQASSPAQQSTNTYDGIWIGSNGGRLLIKQIHHTLYFSGSNPSSAWQAQCIASTSMAKCLGSGLHSNSGEFHYESDIRMHNSRLQVNWAISDHSGHTQTGATTYRKQ